MPFWAKREASYHFLKVPYTLHYGTATLKCLSNEENVTELKFISASSLAVSSQAGNSKIWLLLLLFMFYCNHLITHCSRFWASFENTIKTHTLKPFSLYLNLFKHLKTWRIDKELDPSPSLPPLSFFSPHSSEEQTGTIRLLFQHWAIVT